MKIYCDNECKKAFHKLATAGKVPSHGILPGEGKVSYMTMHRRLRRCPFCKRSTLTSRSLRSLKSSPTTRPQDKKEENG